MINFKHTTLPIIPEQPVVSFESKLGGNLFHGGESTFEISNYDMYFDMTVDVLFSDGKKITITNEQEKPDIISVRLKLSGRWESELLLKALMDMGRKLLANDEALKSYSQMLSDAEKTTLDIPEVP